MSVILVNGVRVADGVTDTVRLRGTGAEGLRLDNGFRLAKGRLFQPGHDEIIVGRAAAAQFRGFTVGSQVVLRGVPWRIVGVFEDKGGFGENEIFADGGAVRQAFDRPASQSVLLDLASAADFQHFRDTLASDPRLQVAVHPYRDYLLEQSRLLTRLTDLAALLVGAVMGAGAAIGVANTIYSAVEARRREIATLRAVGFLPSALALAVLAEALVLTVIGAAFGALLATLVFEGREVSMSGVLFAVSITPVLAITGIAMGALIALVGGAWPAVAAARQPIATALRPT
jgi:putative ABC transport system permease protein